MENKFKHNKKRNTAFLYECLVRELTKAILEKKDNRRNSILMILKEYFSQDTNLSKELKIYRSFEENFLEKEYADRFLNEARIKYLSINKKDLFNEQTSLINTINKNLGIQTYSNFVSNYKYLASISQIFNETTPIKEKILLEEKLKEYICKKEESKQDKLLNNVDNVTYKIFVEKFNNQYGDKLLNEQKNLLTKYVKSNTDNGLDLKIYLNEEIARLKNEINKSLMIDEVKNDKTMLEKVNKLKDYLNSSKDIQISEDMLTKILKIQEFIHEVNLNG